MFMRLVPIAAMFILSTIAAESAEAQAAAADVTFDVPVNLTRLPSDITKIKLKCEIGSSAITQGFDKLKQPAGRRYGEVELPVSQGEVVQTAQVVVPLSSSELNSPSGKQATYECRLAAFHGPPHNAWHDVSTVPQSDAACRLTPKPAPFTGSFVW